MATDIEVGLRYVHGTVELVRTTAGTHGTHDYTWEEHADAPLYVRDVGCYTVLPQILDHRTPRSIRFDAGIPPDVICRTLKKAVPYVRSVSCSPNIIEHGESSRMIWWALMDTHVSSLTTAWTRGCLCRLPNITHMKLTRCVPKCSIDFASFPNLQKLELMGEGPDIWCPSIPCTVTWQLRWTIWDTLKTVQPTVYPHLTELRMGIGNQIVYFPFCPALRTLHIDVGKRFIMTPCFVQNLWLTISGMTWEEAWKKIKMITAPHVRFLNIQSWGMRAEPDCIDIMEHFKELAMCSWIRNVDNKSTCLSGESKFNHNTGEFAQAFADLYAAHMDACEEVAFIGILCTEWGEWIDYGISE